MFLPCAMKILADSAKIICVFLESRSDFSHNFLKTKNEQVPYFRRHNKNHTFFLKNSIRIITYVLPCAMKILADSAKIICVFLESRSDFSHNFLKTKNEQVFYRVQ